MDLIERALKFEKTKLRSLTTSDRIKISREAKELILSLNEIYKKNRDANIMDIMNIAARYWLIYTLYVIALI